MIDPRTLVPFDLETVLESVRRTNRLVVAHEAVEHGGFGAEIAAEVQAAAFDYLDAPIERVGAPFEPVPLSPRARGRLPARRRRGLRGGAGRAGLGSTGRQTDSEPAASQGRRVIADRGADTSDRWAVATQHRGLRLCRSRSRPSKRNWRPRGPASTGTRPGVPPGDRGARARQSGLGYQRVPLAHSLSVPAAGTRTRADASYVAACASAAGSHEARRRDRRRSGVGRGARSLRSGCVRGLLRSRAGRPRAHCHRRATTLASASPRRRRGPAFDCVG